MAVFNFPIGHSDHTKRAVLAARKIKSRWSAKREELAETFRISRNDLGLGIGIHTGKVSFGEFGRSHRDVTAIGTVVNTASRAQSAAEAGQILATQAVYDGAQPE